MAVMPARHAQTTRKGPQQTISDRWGGNLPSDGPRTEDWSDLEVALADGGEGIAQYRS
jgi:hypothetical protein